MDTNDWAYFARCSRLKSNRTKKRLQQKDRDKKLISLAKELQALSRHKPEYEALDPPYQRGWKRTFVLRADQRNLPGADFFQQLLERINTLQLSHRKDFKKKRRRFGKRIYVESTQHLKSLNEYQFVRGDLTETEKMYFEKTLEYHSYRQEFVVVYVFTEAWRLALEVTPNMITHVRLVDTERVKREKEIDRQLTGQNLKARMWKLRQGHYGSGIDWKGVPKSKYNYLFKSEPVQKLKREYETEKLYGNKN